MKTLTERQQTHEVMALYGSGPFKLAQEFKKFEKDSVVWHSMSEKDRRRHVERFRSYKPTLEDYFEKPKTSGAKPNEKDQTKKDQAVVKTILFNDPNTIPPITYELHLRSHLPRMMSKCQGNCGEKIPTSDKEDFLLVKSFGRIQFSLKGEKHTKYGPLYIHFKMIV